MSTPKIDPELVKNGDNRNVIDEYRNWTVEAIKNDMISKSFPLHIAIENIQHDINIGSIIRSANAFNVAGVHIIGKKHWNRRGAMSTEKYLELYYYKITDEFVNWSIQNNKVIIGIDNIEGSKDLSNYEFPKEIVLVFGQEGPGLSEDMQKHCKDILGIAQYGSTRSVNVGVAAGIVLYEWTKQYKST
ncbi:TrmH family RNA methyltransferase [Candidatus Saccharibacteria bacterium]|nr:TrmH family RNA methyltransferase [Candidatus Saccharibacteria bacterium]